MLPIHQAFRQRFFWADHGCWLHQSMCSLVLPCPNFIQSSGNCSWACEVRAWNKTWDSTIVEMSWTHVGLKYIYLTYTWLTWRWYIPLNKRAKKTLDANNPLKTDHFCAFLNSTSIPWPVLIWHWLNPKLSSWNSRKTEIKCIGKTLCAKGNSRRIWMYPLVICYRAIEHTPYLKWIGIVT